MTKKNLLIPLLAALLPACASVNVPLEKRQTILATDARLATMSYQLRTKAAEVCPEQAIAEFGALIGSVRTFSEQFREDAAALYKLDEASRVMAVLPDSPAATAGLMPGDKVVAIDGEEVAPSAKGDRVLSERILAYKGGGAPLTLTIERADRKFPMPLVPGPACIGSSATALEDEVAIFGLEDEHFPAANLSYGFVQHFSRSDDDLLIGMAHGLAHTMLHHTSTRRDRMIWGGPPTGLLAAVVPVASIPIALIGPVLSWRLALSSSVESFELAADELAMKMLEKSGITPRQYLAFWQRFAQVAQDTSSKFWNGGGVHPVSEARLKHLAELAGDQGNSVAQLPRAEER